MCGRGNLPNRAMMSALSRYVSKRAYNETRYSVNTKEDARAERMPRVKTKSRGQHLPRDEATDVIRNERVIMKREDRVKLS